MKVLVLDNYDSFIYNLVHLLRRLPGVSVHVARNDEIELDDVEKFDRIVLSPGPGLPSESGRMAEIVTQFAPSKPILGVCLGHQCIAECFGAELENIDPLCHGVALPTNVLDPGHKLFEGLPGIFPSGRYHSWAVKRSSIPDCLTITADDDQGRVMGIAHRTFDVTGVQFHPESVLTPLGSKILENWIS